MLLFPIERRDEGIRPTNGPNILEELRKMRWPERLSASRTVGGYSWHPLSTRASEEGSLLLAVIRLKPVKMYAQAVHGFALLNS